MSNYLIPHTNVPARADYYVGLRICDANALQTIREIVKSIEEKILEKDESSSFKERLDYVHVNVWKAFMNNPGSVKELRKSFYAIVVPENLSAPKAIYSSLRVQPGQEPGTFHVRAMVKVTKVMNRLRERAAKRFEAFGKLNRPYELHSLLLSIKTALPKYEVEGIVASYSVNIEAPFAAFVLTSKWKPIEWYPQ